MNQIRGLLSEQGIVIARDISQLRSDLPAMPGNGAVDFNEMVRSLMRELQAESGEFDNRIAAAIVADDALSLIHTVMPETSIAAVRCRGARGFTHVGFGSLGAQALA